MVRRNGLVVMMVVSALVWCGLQARAEVTLPSVLGSHMVLQRDQPIPIWGWAAPGEGVTVQLGKAEAKATADNDGRWLARLPAMAAGGPFELTVKGANAVTLTDILVGEVWIGSGQSNMQWSVSAANNPAEEIAAAKYPRVRLFQVPRVPSAQPARDVKAQWQVCAPETVLNFSAVAYFFGREIHKALDVPVGLIDSSWGGTRIEPWTTVAGFASEPKLSSIADRLKAQSPQANEGQPTALYNGMIHPLVPFGIRGALWYQGESNMGEGMLYCDKMKALIGGWREVWAEGPFPFLFVQLAPYAYAKEYDLPAIWEAQTATLAVPNTGMAVITDIGTLRDIHPKNKQDVGKRLALWALARTYGRKDLVYSGPLYKSMAAEGDKIRVRFDHAGSGLAVRGDGPLSWFAIAGDDKAFVKAEAKIDGDSVLVWSERVPKPVAVRLGWHQFAQPNLMNKEGLTASAFRTDQWDPNLPMPGDMVGSSPDWAWSKLAASLTLGDVVLPDKGNTLSIERELENQTYCTGEIEYKWETAGTGWGVKPAEGSLKLGPNQKGALRADVLFDPNRLLPLPSMRATVKINGVKMDDVAVRLQPLIRKVADVPALGKASVVDGAIAEGEYGDAKPVGGFVEYHGLGDAKQPTRFLLAHDDKALYVAIVADEADPKSITAKVTARDGDTWQDDGVELFVDVDRDKKSFHQFGVSAAGTQMDAACGPGHGQWGDGKWNAKWESAAKIGASGYSVEMAIPFEALGVPAPKAGDSWGLNVCRSRQPAGKDLEDPELSQWSLTYTNFHVPANFGVVTFR